MRSLIVSTALLAAGATPAPAAVVSQGVFRMGADALWTDASPGAGQAVAIVDEGFGGLDASIAAGELPPREAMTLRSFDPVNGLDGRDGLEAPTQHGTRMAELVHDVAPGARLVLVNYHDVPQFARAADWVASEGIPVVSHSNSFLDGPFDGTGPAARAVDAAAARGVLWVNSAGNFAQRHWEGVAPPGGAAVPFTVGPAGATLDMHASWADPGASATLVLERQEPDGTWTRRGQGASSGPVSVRVGPLPADAGAWRAVVTQTAGAPTTLTLFSQTVSLDVLGGPTAGSVATPSDARGALSVAAVPWTGDAVAPYSSRGPTDDGRPAPTLAAPTYVTSNPAWPGTAGTSAAAAHAAGAAALLRARRQAEGLPVGPQDMRDALVAGARDIDAPGPDPATGAGLIRLDLAAPAITARVVGRPRRLRVRAFDTGTLERTSVRVDGGPARTARRAQVDVSLARLSPGRHRVAVEARDAAGNVATRTLTVRGGRR